MSGTGGYARIHLASRSPRRRELLHQMGVAFDLLPLREASRDAQLDETPFPGEDPLSYVRRVARSKAMHASFVAHERRLASQPVLAADTTVALDGEIIGKPLDGEDAKRILWRLSGRTHVVMTAVAVCCEGRLEVVVSNSEVRFRTLEKSEIEHYVACGEALDKAGAYGIQGFAGVFVEHLAGSYSGVVGLPLCQTAQLLKRFCCALP